MTDPVIPESKIREYGLETQIRQERERAFVRCLWHENCTMEAGHEKCGECGKGKGGVCSACHCEHTLRVDLRIAERKLEAARNRIDDDTLTSDNLCKSIGVAESLLRDVVPLLLYYRTEHSKNNCYYAGDAGPVCDECKAVDEIWKRVPREMQ